MPKARIAALLPSVDRLRGVFLYDPLTGKFTYRIKKGKRSPGDPAGSHRSDGYLEMKLDYVKFLGNRAAWAIVNGEWPPEDRWIDHRDCDPSNNRIDNLRLSTPTQNLANSRMRRDNTSGIKGVSRRHDGKAWIAHISIDGKARALGSFATAEEASEAYQTAAREQHGEFSRFT